MGAITLPADESAAYLLFEQVRWSDGQPCPHCGATGRHMFITPQNGTARATRTGSMSQRRVWKCHDCRRQFTVLTGTFLAGTRVPLRKWIKLVCRLCERRPWTYRQLASGVGVSVRTVWLMVERVGKAAELDPRLWSLLSKGYA